MCVCLCARVCKAGSTRYSRIDSTVVVARSLHKIRVNASIGAGVVSPHVPQTSLYVCILRCITRMCVRVCDHYQYLSLLPCIAPRSENNRDRTARR